jgi:predicted Zn-dependent protease
LKSSKNVKAKIGLANVFLKKGNASVCIVILKEIIESRNEDLEIFTLYAQALLKENSFGKAVEMY